MNKFFTASLIILKVWPALPVAGEVPVPERNYFYKQLSLQDGLVQSYVRCVFTDHRGYMWIGTRGGLSRFDQTDFRNYVFDGEEPYSLPGNVVSFVIEDNARNLWIGTGNGLARYNRPNDNFIRAEYEGRTFTAFCANEADGRVIFGGNGALYVFDDGSEEIERLPGSEITGQIHSIVRLSENELLCSTRGQGIWVYDFYSRSSRAWPHCTEKNIGRLFIDSADRIWITLRQGGLLCYDLAGERLFHNNSGELKLSNNRVLDIIEDKDELWFATDGGGINIFNPENRSLACMTHKSGDASSLPVNSVYCLYRDGYDNIWAGTVRAGLVNIREVHTRVYRDVVPGSNLGLTERVVISLFEDNDGSVWVGTDGGGINKYIPSKDHFVHYPSTDGLKIASITALNSRQLLLSVFGRELMTFDKRTGAVSLFIIPGEAERERSYLAVLTKQVDNYNGRDVIIYGNRVHSYNSETKIFRELGTKNARWFEGGINLVRSDEHTSWLFNANSITMLDHASGELALMVRVPENVYINSVSADADGNFWIGTDKGLFMYDAKKEILDRLPTSLFTEVGNVVCGTAGRVWIGSRGSVYVYERQNDKLVTLGEPDGIVSNEYLHKACLVTRNHTYMGGTNGLLKINNDITFPEEAPSLPHIMDIMENDRSVFDGSGGKHGKLTLSYNHATLTVRLINNGDDVFRKKVFRYTLGEHELTPIEIQGHDIILQSLSPGEYNIRVASLGRNGVWSEPEELLVLTVNPPWWKSNLFIMLSAVVLLAILASIFYSIFRREKNRLRWSLQEKENEIKEEKIRFLINISHELRTPLTLIYAPLKRLLDRMPDREATETELQGMFRQARKMKNMLNTILDARKMEVGKGELHMGLHGINDWLADTVSDFRNELAAKNVALEFEFSKEVGEVPFDECKIDIVVSNLMMNAVNFSNPGTKVVVSTSAADDGSYVRIAVRDYGPGIEEGDLQGLFTRFYQGKSKKKGTGIGLSYSKMLVEMHHGKIGVFSNSGAGATLWFDLPVAASENLAKLEQKPYLNVLLNDGGERLAMFETEPSIFPVSKYTALVVEDEPELRRFIKDSLAAEFEHVYMAENGIDALLSARQNSPDIIVSDVMMPEMDGFELCYRLKNDLEISHIPVILLTALDDGNSETAGYKTGADAYLSKPFEIDFLMTVIRNNLRTREHIKTRYKSFNPGLSHEEITFSNADEKFILKLNEIINDNIADSKLDLRLVTREMAMSKTSLYNKMKVLCNVSLSEYITKLRIGKAALLLSDSNLSIAEVAESTGFGSQKYFSTVFKRTTGITPSEYRKETQN